MFKFIAIFLAINLLTSSCRKKVEKDVLTYEETLGFTPHCYNNQMDFDEVGTDCGGECEPCEQNYPTCEIIPDVFDLEYGLLIVPVTSYSSTGPGWSDQYVFTAFADEGRYLEFTFEGKINIMNYYKGTNSVFLDPDEVGIKYGTDAGTTLYCGYEERLYVNLEDDHYILSGCDMVFSSGLHISFKLTF